MTIHPCPVPWMARGEHRHGAREKPRRLARLGGDSMQFAKVHGIEGPCHALRFFQLIITWYNLSRAGQEKTPPFGGVYDDRILAAAIFGTR